MTQDEFEEAYASRAGLPRAELFRAGCQISMRCVCGEQVCSGWAAVSDSPLAIRSHEELYQREHQPQPGAGVHC